MKDDGSASLMWSRFPLWESRTLPPFSPPKGAELSSSSVMHLHDLGEYVKDESWVIALGLGVVGIFLSLTAFQL
jgi:hypothetical protein